MLIAESLSRGPHRLSVPPPPRVARGRRGRKDHRQQQPHRRVGGQARTDVYEVPVGFKWFVDGLLNGSLGFAGEESAGSSFLRRDGDGWTTDKDGLVAGLLAAEIAARTNRDPGEPRESLAHAVGDPIYERSTHPQRPSKRRSSARCPRRTWP